MDDEELLKEAKDRFELCKSHFADMYNDQRSDWDFLHGIGQWDVDSLKARDKDDRPSLVLNQLLPYAHQITNDIKQARLAIRVVPIDSEADVETADVRSGIIRNIEKQSRAKNVYGAATMNAVGGGLGWIRVIIDYADTDTFDQEAFLERIVDPSKIYLDPQFMSMDGSDAQYGFDLEGLSYTKDAFEELYPNAAAISFDGNGATVASDDLVELASYYYIETKPFTLTEVVVVDERGEEQTLALKDDQLKKLDDTQWPYEKKRSRKVEGKRVFHCILNGQEVLSKEEFPSQYIPLVPVIGEEVLIDGTREFHSLIKQARDSQSMYNYWKSASTEMIALQPKAPFIAPVGSFVSYPDDWMNANTQNLSTLEYDVVYDKNGMPMPPPQRQPPIVGSPAMMQEAISARDDIRLSLGIPQSNMGEKSNAVSGIAIRNQQIEGDNATFHFIDNLSSSIAQVGRILNEIIPAIYSERKVLRIIGEDGEEENVPVNTPYVKEEGEIRPAKPNEKPTGKYDLDTGKYDVDMDVGASYSSKRQETADKLIEAMNVNPDLSSVAMDLVFEALDLPMGKQIAERIKSTMNPAVLGDDPQAAKLQEASKALEEMQEKLLNYEAALADKEKNQKFDNALKAENAQLDRDKFQVDAQKTKADIDKIYADIKTANEAQENNNIDEVVDHVNSLSEAMEILIDDSEKAAASNGNTDTSEPLIEGENKLESETQ